jgi:hypothetical protein
LIILGFTRPGFDRKSSIEGIEDPDASAVYARFTRLIHLVQYVLAPKPIKRMNEPIGSMLASYRPGELEDIFSDSKFPE